MSNAMDRLVGIARYTLQEHWRHRIYLSSLLFGLVLLAGGLVVSSLAVEARLRMMVDLGLAAIEFIALISIVFTSVNLVLSEIESRTIYLLLSHPLPRWQYLTGRFLGTLAAISLGIALMAIAHMSLLKLMGWTWSSSYGLALACAFLKITVVGALALFLSIFSSSAPTAMTFTVFLWIVGHFSTEMKFIADRSGNPLVKALIGLFYYVAPNFSTFNYRDFSEALQMPPAAWYGDLALYAFAYTLTCLFLSNLLFEKREF